MKKNIVPKHSRGSCLRISIFDLLSNAAYRRTVCSRRLISHTVVGEIFNRHFRRDTVGPLSTTHRNRISCWHSEENPLATYGSQLCDDDGAPLKRAVSLNPPGCHSDTNLRWAKNRTNQKRSAHDGSAKRQRRTTAKNHTYGVLF